MRVLYFSRDYTTHDWRFLTKLAESQHEVWFLRLEDEGVGSKPRSLPERVRPVAWRGGGQRAVTPDGWLQLMPEYESILEQVHPDLVHAGPVQSCGLMTALAGFHPFFVMSWGSDILVDSGRDGFWRWMTRYALAHSDRLVCDNDAVRLKVRQLVPYPENRMVQFPWGVDVQQFAPGEDVRRLRDKLGWHDSFLVLSTRSWEKIYGVETLLDAFRLAHSHNSSLRLVMLGSGSLAPNVEKAIAEFGIEHVVALPGRVANELLPDYYRAADLYLSCTTSDGTSVSLLEAMATGLPVIVADVPGNREWVTEGDNGWLAGVADSAAFARAIIEAAELRPEERSRIASRNRRIVEQRANWDSNFPKLLAAYDEAGTEHAC